MQLLAKWTAEESELVSVTDSTVDFEASQDA
jgi:hypothetical protein